MTHPVKTITALAVAVVMSIAPKGCGDDGGNPNADIEVCAVITVNPERHTFTISCHDKNTGKLIREQEVPAAKYPNCVVGSRWPDC